MQPDEAPRIETPNIRPRNEDYKYTMYTDVQNTCGALALWLQHRTINYQENPGSNTTAAVSKLGQLSFPHRCHSSLSYINEYLTIDSGR